MNPLAKRTQREHHAYIDRKRERFMSALLQDVASLVAVSLFIVSMAMWIGAY
jgi:hypothetical protein